jgi:hypothetical protein
VSVVPSIRGRSHPRLAGPLPPAHTYALRRDVTYTETGASGAAGIRGRSHPRLAGPLLPAHTGTPLCALTRPLYQREPNSVKPWNSLLKGSTTRRISAVRICSASIWV